jgi:hypothetical protein
MMVPQISAIHAGKFEENYDQYSIDADHSAIVKFTDPHDGDYKVIESKLKKLAENGPRVINERIRGHRTSEFLSYVNIEVSRLSN